MHQTWTLNLIGKLPQLQAGGRGHEENKKHKEKVLATTKFRFDRNSNYSVKQKKKKGRYQQSESYFSNLVCPMTQTKHAVFGPNSGSSITIRIVESERLEIVEGLDLEISENEYEQEMLKREQFQNEISKQEIQSKYSDVPKFELNLELSSSDSRGGSKARQNRLSLTLSSFGQDEDSQSKGSISELWKGGSGKPMIHSYEDLTEEQQILYQKVKAARKLRKSKRRRTVLKKNYFFSKCQKQVYESSLDLEFLHQNKYKLSSAERRKLFFYSSSLQRKNKAIQIDKIFLPDIDPNALPAGFHPILGDIRDLYSNLETLNKKRESQFRKDRAMLMSSIYVTRQFSNMINSLVTVQGKFISSLSHLRKQTLLEKIEKFSEAKLSTRSSYGWNESISMFDSMLGFSKATIEKSYEILNHQIIPKLNELLSKMEGKFKQISKGHVAISDKVTEIAKKLWSEREKATDWAQKYERSRRKANLKIMDDPAILFKRCETCKRIYCTGDCGSEKTYKRKDNISVKGILKQGAVEHLLNKDFDYVDPVVLGIKPDFDHVIKAADLRGKLVKHLQRHHDQLRIANRLYEHYNSVESNLLHQEFLQTCKSQLQFVVEMTSRFMKRSSGLDAFTSHMKDLTHHISCVELIYRNLQAKAVEIQTRVELHHKQYEYERTRNLRYNMFWKDQSRPNSFFTHRNFINDYPNISKKHGARLNRIYLQGYLQGIHSFEKTADKFQLQTPPVLYLHKQYRWMSKAQVQHIVDKMVETEENEDASLPLPRYQAFDPNPHVFSAKQIEAWYERLELEAKQTELTFARFDTSVTGKVQKHRFWSKKFKGGVAPVSTHSLSSASGSEASSPNHHDLQNEKFLGFDPLGGGKKKGPVEHKKKSSLFNLPKLKNNTSTEVENVPDKVQTPRRKRTSFASHISSVAGTLHGSISRIDLNARATKGIDNQEKKALQLSKDFYKIHRDFTHYRNSFLKITNVNNIPGDSSVYSLIHYLMTSPGAYAAVANFFWEYGETMNRDYNVSLVSDPSPKIPFIPMRELMNQAAESMKQGGLRVRAGPSPLVKLLEKERAKISVETIAFPEKITDQMYFQVDFRYPKLQPTEKQNLFYLNQPYPDHTVFLKYSDVFEEEKDLEEKKETISVPEGFVSRYGEIYLIGDQTYHIPAEKNEIYKLESIESYEDFEILFKEEDQQVDSSAKKSLTKSMNHVPLLEQLELVSSETLMDLLDMYRQENYETSLPIHSQAQYYHKNLLGFGEILAVDEGIYIILEESHDQVFISVSDIENSRFSIENYGDEDLDLVFQERYEDLVHEIDEYLGQHQGTYSDVVLDYTPEEPFESIFTEEPSPYPSPTVYLQEKFSLMKRDSIVGVNNQNLETLNISNVIKQTRFTQDELSTLKHSVVVDEYDGVEDVEDIDTSQPYVEESTSKLCNGDSVDFQVGYSALRTLTRNKAEINRLTNITASQIEKFYARLGKQILSAKEDSRLRFSFLAFANRKLINERFVDTMINLDKSPYMTSIQSNILEDSSSSSSEEEQPSSNVSQGKKTQRYLRRLYDEFKPPTSTKLVKNKSSFGFEDIHAVSIKPSNVLYAAIEPLPPLSKCLAKISKPKERTRQKKSRFAQQIDKVLPSHSSDLFPHVLNELKKSQAHINPSKSNRDFVHEVLNPGFAHLNKSALEDTIFENLRFVEIAKKSISSVENQVENSISSELDKIQSDLRSTRKIVEITYGSNKEKPEIELGSDSTSSAFDPSKQFNFEYQEQLKKDYKIKAKIFTDKYGSAFESLISESKMSAKPDQERTLQNSIKIKHFLLIFDYLMSDNRMKHYTLSVCKSELRKVVSKVKQSLANEQAHFFKILKHDPSNTFSSKHLKRYVDHMKNILSVLKVLRLGDIVVNSQNKRTLRYSRRNKSLRDTALTLFSIPYVSNHILRDFHAQLQKSLSLAPLDLVVSHNKTHALNGGSIGMSNGSSSFAMGNTTPDEIRLPPGATVASLKKHMMLQQKANQKNKFIFKRLFDFRCVKGIPGTEKTIDILEREAELREMGKSASKAYYTESMMSKDQSAIKLSNQLHALSKLRKSNLKKLRKSIEDKNEKLFSTLPQFKIPKPQEVDKNSSETKQEELWMNSRSMGKLKDIVYDEIAFSYGENRVKSRTLKSHVPNIDEKEEEFDPDKLNASLSHQLMGSEMLMPSLEARFAFKLDCLSALRDQKSFVDYKKRREAAKKKISSHLERQVQYDILMSHSKIQHLLLQFSQHTYNNTSDSDEQTKVLRARIINEVKKYSSCFEGEHFAKNISFAKIFTIQLIKASQAIFTKKREAYFEKDTGADPYYLGNVPGDLFPIISDAFPKRIAFSLDEAFGKNIDNIIKNKSLHVESNRMDQVAQDLNGDSIPVLDFFSDCDFEDNINLIKLQNKKINVYLDTLGFNKQTVLDVLKKNKMSVPKRKLFFYTIFRYFHESYFNNSRFMKPDEPIFYSESIWKHAQDRYEKSRDAYRKNFMRQLRLEISRVVNLIEGVDLYKRSLQISSDYAESVGLHLNFSSEVNTDWLNQQIRLQEDKESNDYLSQILKHKQLLDPETTPLAYVHHQVSTLTKESSVPADTTSVPEYVADTMSLGDRSTLLQFVNSTLSQNKTTWFGENKSLMVSQSGGTELAKDRFFGKIGPVEDVINFTDVFTNNGTFVYSKTDKDKKKSKPKHKRRTSVWHGVTRKLLRKFSRKKIQHAFNRHFDEVLNNDLRFVPLNISADMKSKQKKKTEHRKRLLHNELREEVGKKDTWKKNKRHYRLATRVLTHKSFLQESVFNDVFKPSKPKAKKEEKQEEKVHREPLHQKIKRLLLANSSSKKPFNKTTIIVLPSDSSMKTKRMLLKLYKAQVYRQRKIQVEDEILRSKQTILKESLPTVNVNKNVTLPRHKSITSPLSSPEAKVVDTPEFLLEDEKFDQPASQLFQLTSANSLISGEFSDYEQYQKALTNGHVLFPIDHRIHRFDLQSLMREQRIYYQYLAESRRRKKLAKEGKTSEKPPVSRSDRAEFTILNRLKVLHKKHSDYDQMEEFLQKGTSLEIQLMNHQRKSFSAENLVFFHEIDEYIQVLPYLSPEVVLASACELYETFIREDSQCQVNLSSTTNQRFLKALNSGEHGGIVEMIHHVRSEIEDLMWANKAPFMKSEEFMAHLESEILKNRSIIRENRKMKEIRETGSLPSVERYF